MGHSSLALLKVQPGDGVHEHLDVINRLTKSGGDLTRHILGFARGGKYELKPTDLNKLLSHHNRVFGRTHKRITIKERLSDAPCTVEVDRGQIEQVLFNIYINSAQAMPGKGTLFVTTQNVHFRDTGPFTFPVKPGAYIEAAIRDTGSGMDAPTIEKIFEPFFTTKEKGVGTGLGMAAAYGIIKNHGGYIHVRSELGVGTTITILLPRSEKNCRTETAPPAAGIEKGAGTILIVDDEEEILRVETEMLRVMGYDALTVTGGSDAVVMFREKKDAIDLVILDMIMPDMDGAETFTRLKEIDANVKVLFQTGNSLEQVKGKRAAEGSLGIIQKPFTIDSMSKKLKEVMGESDSHI
jgi:CheY-like chemotaxis protein